MSKNEIQAVKEAVAKAYPQASALQYHPATGSISGYGWQLVRPVHAVTNLDARGNGRFTLERQEVNGEWTSVEGGLLVEASA